MTPTSHSIMIRAVLISLPAAIPVLMLPIRMHTNSECLFLPNFTSALSLIQFCRFGFYCMLCVCVCVWVSHVSSLSSIHVFVDNPLCVSVPPHDVKRMAWNSTGNSSCPDSELSQSSMPAAPLGSNAVAAINNTKQSKNTVLTNLTSAFPCRLLTDAITH